MTRGRELARVWRADPREQAIAAAAPRRPQLEARRVGPRRLELAQHDRPGPAVRNRDQRSAAGARQPPVEEVSAHGRLKPGRIDELRTHADQPVVAGQNRAQVRGNFVTLDELAGLQDRPEHDARRQCAAPRARSAPAARPSSGGGPRPSSDSPQRGSGADPALRNRAAASQREANAARHRRTCVPYAVIRRVPDPGRVVPRDGCAPLWLRAADLRRVDGTRSGHAASLRRSDRHGSGRGPSTRRAPKTRRRGRPPSIPATDTA